MKPTYLFLACTLLCLKSQGQDSLWKKYVFNEVLTLNVPLDNKKYNSSFVKAIGGEVKENFFGLQHYDTVFLPINNEELFQISLTGFISGRVSDTTLKKYNVVVVDTTFGGTKGLLAKFTTRDTSEFYRLVYFYVTLANNKYYWFYVHSPYSNDNNEEISYFFKSILFDSEKLKEKSFKLTKVYLTKDADQ